MSQGRLTALRLVAAGAAVTLCLLPSGAFELAADPPSVERLVGAARHGGRVDRTPASCGHRRDGRHACPVCA